ncbi:MAG: hypothetical protein ACREVG_16165, partial [Burkholderiales bacterium]
MRRTGELGEAQQLAQQIEDALLAPKLRQTAFMQLIRQTVIIERAWIDYGGAVTADGYQTCIRRLRSLDPVGAGAVYDGRILLERHLLLALCAKRLALLDPSLEEASRWARRALGNFNAALKYC